jgi:alpha-methylacyl-CoA racemase
VVDDDGVVQPTPAPRFSGTPASVDRPAPEAGQHTDEVLADLGYDGDAVAALRAAATVA